MKDFTMLMSYIDSFEDSCTVEHYLSLMNNQRWFLSKVTTPNGVYKKFFALEAGDNGHSVFMLHLGNVHPARYSHEGLIALGYQTKNKQHKVKRPIDPNTGLYVVHPDELDTIPG